TDSQGEIYEFNANGHADAEQNNTAQAGFDATLDLQVSGLSLNPATGVQSGQTVVVSWSDVNAGNLPSRGSFSDSSAIRNLSTGQTLGTATVAYDATARGAIAAGGSASQQYSFRLPDGNPGVGTIQFTVTTDSTNQVFESN